MYQSLNNKEMAGDVAELNQPDAMNELGAMSESNKSGMLPPLTSIWGCPHIIKCTGVDQDGNCYAGWKY